MAAICSLLPYAQLATIESQPDQIVSCTSKVSVLTLPRVNAAGNASAGKSDPAENERCVVLQPILPYGWDFDVEVTAPR